ncbi:MAG TPA: nucleotidyltransferase family protein [Candidatus Acidoferrum sp.]|jgi:hypothetical protein
MTKSTNSPFCGNSFDNEWKFLCLCASPVTRDLKGFPISLYDFDWMMLLELAEAHGMLGILTARLKGINFAGVPTSFREELQSRMRGQHLFSLGMTAELFRILGDFAHSGIESLLVKGPLMSLLAYNDPSVRSYGDLDLLVRHKQILAASQRMIDSGFEPDVPLSVIVSGKVPGEYVFKRPGTKQIVELHTERTLRYYPRPVPLESLFARQRRVLMDGQQIPALRLEDEFVFHSVHGAKDFWERLMWVADIAAIVARHPEIDWSLLRKYASDVGAERMVHVALQLTQILLNVPLPQAMEDEVKRDTTAAQLCKQVIRWLPSAGYAPPELRERAIFRMRMRGGHLAGAAYLLRLSFSPTEEDWVEGHEENRSWFLDAVQRPLRLLRKYRSHG